LDRQARTLGQAQFAAVRGDGAVLAGTFRQVADLHDELVHTLTQAV